LVDFALPTPAEKAPASRPRFTASATSAHESGGRTFFRSANAQSEVSEEAAHAAAKALARERAASAAAGRALLSALGQYPYPDSAIVEPVLERLDAPRPWWKRLMNPLRAPLCPDENVFSNCRFVRTIGTAAEADAGIALVVARHDATSRALEGKPLA
jgi:hypothetical protein